MSAAPRTRGERRLDTERRLAEDVDLWVASAAADGTPHLVPLSFHWDGETVLLATPAHSPTGRNLARAGRVRLGLGPTRDVTVLAGTVEVRAMAELPPERADAFVRRTGFDPRPLAGPYCWYLVRPERVQAWREVEELTGRDLMRAGEWLA